MAKDSILAKILAEAGYHIEPMVGDENRTVVVTFAVSDERVRPVGEISIWEQVQNVVDYQRYWADNQVSCTVKFRKEEASQIRKVLFVTDQLETMSKIVEEIRSHGIEVIVASSLELASYAIRRTSFDLVVTGLSSDLQSEETTVELLRYVRQYSAHTTVIVASKDGRSIAPFISRYPA